MAMSIDQLFKMPGVMLLIVTALSVLVLGGCQHTAPSDAGETPTTWRVLERVGDVRAAKDKDAATDHLRPGASITGAHQVTTGMGAVLILASDDIQLTAGENTTFSLGDTSTVAGLFLHQGWLRVRLARAADRKASIKTDNFDIHASSATLTLRTSPLGDDLAIDDGSATIATPDGRHHATLVAGAAARVDPSSGQDLLIKRASSEAFSKLTPLEATQQHGDDIEDQSAPARDRQPTPPATALSPDAESTAAQMEVHRQIVRPASRLRTVSDPNTFDAEEDDLPPTRPSVRKAAALNQTAVSTTWKKEKTPDHGRGRFSPSSIPDPFAPVQQIETIVRPTSVVDPLQIQFDRLTEGLLDGL